MKVLTKQQLMAIDNMAILMQAKNDGLQIEQEDLLVNYAEIDHTLSDLETSWGERASERMLIQFMKWLRKVEKPEDLDLKKMDLMMQPLLMEFVQDVWDYGQQTAEDEISVIEAQSFAEATGGKAREGNLTNEDAFEWYQKYMKELARSGQEAAFIYMQPLILEKLESGTVRMELAQSLEEDFRRFGQVRTQIIARTESNKAFNWGRRYRFDKSPAIAGYRYSSILDERTTEICNYLHGHSWAIGDPGLDENTPPNHYQCRGLIVAINKYRSFTFDPPEAGWEDGLPDKEKKVYEKFKDSTYYPKADTVIKQAPPKMEPPKKVAAPKKKAAPKPKKAAAPAPAPDAKAEKLIDDLIVKGHDSTVAALETFLSTNLKRGINPNHPSLKSSQTMMDDIKSGAYNGQMISMDWDSKKKMNVIKTFERLGNVFWRKGTSSIKAADRDRMLSEIRQVAMDPLFTGVKISLINSKTLAGSYQASTDVLEYSVQASQTSKRQSVEGGELGTLYHEIGHRVHNATPVNSSPYELTLKRAGITILGDFWWNWEKATEPFWDSKMTKRGADTLPEDLYLRYAYPINAKQYYTNGTKGNFHKEMFAETSAVYLENNPEEMKKVDRTYPGLLSLLEGVYKRGNYTGGKTND